MIITVFYWIVNSFLVLFVEGENVAYLLYKYFGLVVALRIVGECSERICLLRGGSFFGR